MIAVRRRITLRRAETIGLCLVGLVLAVATVYDLTREVRIDDRIHADVASWHAITGSHEVSLLIKQDIKPGTTRDSVCGPVQPFFFHRRFLACLIFQGTVRADRRVVAGGYYFESIYRYGRWLLNDLPSDRYGCFGDAAAEGFHCDLRVPPGAPDRPLVRA